MARSCEQHLLEARARAQRPLAEPVVHVLLPEIGVGRGHKDSPQDEHDAWVLESVRLRAE
jgi:hypothetical protein